MGAVIPAYVWQATCDALLRASVQGGIVALFVWVLCRVCRRIPARVRFVLWWLVAAKFLLTLLPLRVFIAVPLPVAHDHPAARWLAPLSPRPVRTALRRTARPIRQAQRQIAAAPTVLPPVVPNPAGTLPARRSLWTTDWRTVLPIAAVLVWAIGSVGAFLFLLLGAERLRRLLRASKTVAVPGTAPLQQSATRAAQAVGLRRVPCLLLSPHCVAPFTAGLLRPVIVLPHPWVTGLSHSEQTMVLSHEMAHLRRADLPMTLLPALVRSVFFFHPLAHVIWRECLACREEACDALVLQVTGAPRDGYGRLLLKMVAAQQGLERSLATPALAVGMATRNFQLLRRRLQAMSVDLRQRLSHRGRALLTALVTCVVVVALPWRFDLDAWAATSATMGEGASDTGNALRSLINTRYTVVDLGTLGGTYSDAMSVNDQGIVVGSANLSGDASQGHAVLWDAVAGRVQDMNERSRYRRGSGYAINNRGQATGTAFNRAGREYAFFWDGTQRIYLPTPPQMRYVRPVGLNDAGTVVGVAQTGRSEHGARIAHAFLWTAGTDGNGRATRDLGTLGGRFSNAYAVNNRGVVIGKADLPNGETHAFRWRDTPFGGTMDDLGTLAGGNNSLAYAVNENNAVVGVSERSANMRHAFYSEPGGDTPVDLGTLPGGTDSVAYAVNNRRQVVGTSTNADGMTRAVLWQRVPGAPGGEWRMVDLNRHIVHVTGQEGFSLEVARAINRNGQIVGQARMADGRQHAVLLTPNH